MGGVRTKLVERIPGGVSALLKQLLVAMFVDGPHNFTDGFVVPHGSAALVFRARLVGFMADEKGHKEFFAIKGAAGLKPCISRMNGMNFIHKKGYADGQYTGSSRLVRISLWNRGHSLFTMCHVYGM